MKKKKNYTTESFIFSVTAFQEPTFLQMCGKIELNCRVRLDYSQNTKKKFLQNKFSILMLKLAQHFYRKGEQKFVAFLR